MRLANTPSGRSAIAFVFKSLKNTLQCINRNGVVIGRYSFPITLLDMTNQKLVHVLVPHKRLLICLMRPFLLSPTAAKQRLDVN